MPPAPRRNAPPPSNAEDFLRLILKSGLLTKEQLQTSLRPLPAEQRVKTSAVADHLIKLGKLSRFQARKLMQGTYRGLVLGPFQVLAPIGRGAMGMVYLARDHRSGQLLALKVLPPERARTEKRVLARFRREMEMSQKVSNPHVAWTFDLGVCQGVHYIAMEYIPGKTLQRVVAEQGPLPPARAARLIAETAAALEHIHTQGLVHRDIKPANIMITPHDHIKILDLGLALTRGEEGAAREVVGGQGYVVGTMDYIAPEQTEDPTKVDGRADIYSLGCTMYFALTGMVPYPGGTNRDKIQRQCNEQARPLGEIKPDLPPDLIAVVERMMAKNPADRPQSGTQVEEELKRRQSAEAVLPMDRPEDLAFLEEVARLEASETAEDEELPPVEGSSEAAVQPLGEVLTSSPDRSMHLLVALACGGLIVGILLVVMILRWLK